MHGLGALALVMVLAAVAPRDGRHDFDSEFGTWRVQVERLTGEVGRRQHWTRYCGTHTVRPLWHGRANIGVLEIDGPAGHIEGMQLRLYDPATQLWKLSFASSADGELQPPMIGSFHDGVGEFREAGHVDGKTVISRAVSTPIDARSYKDVISQSYDGGSTWKTVWVANYKKEPKS
jgi:hypothetical protein